MADSSSLLPPPVQSTTPSGAGLPPSASGTTSTTPPLTLNLGVPRTDSRDAIIGIVVLVVLAILFFVIKNAYANWRVKDRVSPSRANASGWFLFLALLAGAAIGVLAFINPVQFMAPMFLAPLGVLALISLIAALMTFSAKR
jgi:hypothetical protein